MSQHLCQHKNVKVIIFTKSMSRLGFEVNVVYVKLGGSLLTVKNRPVAVNFEALSSVTKVLWEAVNSSIKLVVGNGGGSFAHYVVLKHRDRDYRDLLVWCNRSTRLLNGLVVDYLLDAGIRATSVQTSSIVYYDEDAGELRANAKVVKNLVEKGVVPVVYGECILGPDGIVVVSTERVFELLARSLSPTRVVLLTDVSGVYTCDPKKCTEASLVRKITRSNIDEVLSLLKSSEQGDATGGMYGKVKMASRLAFELGVEVVITSGLDKDAALKAIVGDEPERATIIDPKS